ncbi:MAG: FAD-dependent oxidoreductase [Bacillati bacterium ANGP1]|uniref:FAD-dependent oxidoreductase n=1 Tax=Candidatus Segetimicrobium genomatis TaxID=2569760 RepID=A0A537LJM4_9BACT|nr:MAG: FAD-dependent oxidoreductase [Terrabacteria group bacterium ANGP1]
MGGAMRSTVFTWAGAVGCALLALSGLSAPASGGPTVGQGWCTASVPVLVVGGTPAGVAAAVSAARLGSRVMLIEARPYLGGDLTGAMLNMFDMDFGPGGQHLARGVFMEIYQQLGMTFDVELAKHVFLQEVRRESRVTLRLLVRPVDVIMQGPLITGVVVEDLQTHEHQTLCAKRIIDATDDADIAAMAGVPYLLGRQGSGIDRAMMAATLVFELDGVNWREVVGYVTSRPGPRSLRGGIYHGNAWGYSDIMRGYRPIMSGTGIYDLNLGRQNDGTVLVNGLLIYGVDGTDPGSVDDGVERARAELPVLLAYLRARAPGFEHADLVRAADYLYIRETRHVRGLYTLTVHDVVNSRVFWDAIGVASYPIDLHPYRPGDHNPYAANRYVYTIPLRALVPYRVDNLLVASRAISASYEAAGSARVAPTTMEEGQAAGVAAVLSIRARVTLPRFTEAPPLVHELQETLFTQGAYLLPETMAAAVGSSPNHVTGPAMVIPRPPQAADPLAPQ